MDDQKNQNNQEQSQLHGDADATLAPDCRPPGAGRKVIQYLSERVPVFRELAQLRAKVSRFLQKAYRMALTY